MVVDSSGGVLPFPGLDGTSTRVDIEYNERVGLASFWN